ncbi:MAG: LysR family transcriptional regulator [Desulfobacteraceae bacterium]|nr:MAG: LysR family transcriptional regulator [Desulfobacteraceae bacterium]
MLPDFNRLKVFYHICLQTSVAGAARDLNITASAVSQSLTKLEEELKTPLFIRLHKKLVPTLAGEELFGILQPFVESLEQGLESIVSRKKIPSGALRIGSPIEFGKSYFPGLFAAFRNLYPEVVFTMMLGDPSQIFPMIASGELDFGLVDAFLTREQLIRDFGIYSIEPLIDEEVILACSKVYYDQRIKGEHSYKNLVNKEFISYQKSSLPLVNWFKYHFNKYSTDLNRVLTVDSHQAVISGIKSHIGLGVIATHIVDDELKSGEIVPIRTQKKDVINKISLVILQDKIPTLTEKAFINFLKKDIQRTGTAKKFLTSSHT